MNKLKKETKSKMGYKTFVAFDTESTGFYPNDIYSKLIEVGAVKVVNGEVVDRFSEFVNPELSIPKRIRELTGITDETVKDAKNVDEVLKEFKKWLGDDVMLVGHNIKHDLTFVNYFGSKSGVLFNEYPTIDTQAVAKELTKKHGVQRSGLKLAELAKDFGVKDENHHRAENDALVTAEVFLKLIEEAKSFEKIGETRFVDIKPYVAKRKIVATKTNFWQKHDFKRLYVDVTDGDGEYAKGYYDFCQKTWCQDLKKSTYTVLEWVDLEDQIALALHLNKRFKDLNEKEINELFVNYGGVK